MTSFVLLALLLFAPPPPVTMDQVKAEPNLERRARLAIDFAVAQERAAETAYDGGDMVASGATLKAMADAMTIAQESLAATGKKAGRNPAPYKYGEQRSRELLVRLGDLERKMDSSEREAISAPMAKVQEIHDAWFEGIMGKSK